MRFKDSVMFIGWYMSKTNKINKIPLNDSYRQYLNYYLGWGNYAQKVYKTDKKAIIFALALVTAFLVLAANFNSFLSPFVIFLTVPLALFGGLLFLNLFNSSINILDRKSVV